METLFSFIWEIWKEIIIHYIIKMLDKYLGDK